MTAQNQIQRASDIAELKKSYSPSKINHNYNSDLDELYTPNAKTANLPNEFFKTPQKSDSPK